MDSTEQFINIVRIIETSTIEEVANLIVRQEKEISFLIAENQRLVDNTDATSKALMHNPFVYNPDKEITC